MGEQIPAHSANTSQTKETDVAFSPESGERCLECAPITQRADRLLQARLDGKELGESEVEAVLASLAWDLVLRLGVSFRSLLHTHIPELQLQKVVWGRAQEPR